MKIKEPLPLCEHGVDLMVYLFLASAAGVFLLLLSSAELVSLNENIRRFICGEFGIAS
jgi:hypothetical protein